MADLGQEGEEELARRVNLQGGPEDLILGSEGESEECGEESTLN